MKKKKGKGKDSRAEAAKRKQQELKEDMMQSMAKLGLDYHDDEIPPDEVDQGKVAKPIMFTLKSLIPYTNEWYQANEAEDEMDDFRALQVETAKAKNLVTLSKIGKHEQALGIMMADTNHDFHYFNKMKLKATEEGKFKVDIKLLPKTTKRSGNRLQSAVDAPLPVFGGDTSSSATSFQLAVDLTGSASKGCIWRGKDAAGVPLKCLNPQLPDPKHRKQSKNSPDVLLSYCAYHNPFCFGDHNGDGQVTIKFPNKDTFCTDCYLAKHKRQPGKLPPGRIPGVVNAQTGKPMGGAPVAEDEEMGVDEELPVCGWKPDKIEALTEMRGYVCKNRCYRDPTSKMLMSTCAMHIRKCVKMHSGDDGKIDIRNIFGLCMMHHIAEHGEPPIEVPLPYPGMERRLRSKGWKIKPGHFFAPTWPRKEDIIYKKQYIAPPKPTNFIEQIRLQAKQNEYKRRVKLLGKLAATIIQTYFRRYRLLGCHRNLIFAANARRRTDSALIIQCFGRRYNGRKVFLARLKRDADAAVFIQRAYRGYRGRLYVRRLKAAIFIKKSFRRVKARKFQEAVMAVISMKRLLRKRGRAVVSIQRVIRGFACRNKVVRYLQFLVNQSLKSSKIISRALRRYRDIKWKERNKSKNIDAIKRFQMGLRIGLMLKRVYLNYLQRKELMKLRNIKVLVLQRNIRRFCGMAVANNLKYLREALQNWCKPQFAIDFLQEQMAKKVPMCKYGLAPSGKAISSNDFAVGTNRINSAATTSSRGTSRTDSKGSVCIRGPVFIRAHLDPSEITKPKIDKKLFEDALRSYYVENGYHFSEAESECIVKTFKDLTTGKIDMVELDSYVSRHKEACTLHGRNICGVCFFYKECGFRKCKCKCFTADFLGNALNCIECSHSNVLHLKYPLQLQSDKRFKGLKKSLTSSKRPDMEIPSTVIGVKSTTIALYEPPPKVKRPGTGDSRKSNSTSYSDMIENEEADLVSGLASGHVEGNTMAQTVHTRDYWGQDELSMSLNGSKGFYLPADHGYTVCADEVPPNTNISTQEFWNAVMTNPNKSVRDYNEKFEHNMPMPIVANGELVYTIEGAKVYVMLLARLIYFGEKGLIHHDSGDLLRLIVDHMQLFERHWRKMVVDIRNGTLNRHCKVSTQDRTEFESSNLPRPKIATTLDDTFRKLGFHMKVLGKDITEKPFAEKKAPKNPPLTFEERGGVEESLLQFHLKSRRLSTPIESIEGLLLSEQRQQSGASTEFDGTASMGWQASRGSSRVMLLSSSGRIRPSDRTASPSELSLLQAISNKSRPSSRLDNTKSSSKASGHDMTKIQLNSPQKPLSPTKSKRVSFLAHDGEAGITDGVGVPMNPGASLVAVDLTLSNTPTERLHMNLSASSLLPVAEQSKKTGPSMSALIKIVGAEMVERMSDFEESSKIRGPSRRIISKTDPKLTRRGSETDIIRPAVAQDLHEISYKLETDARSKYDRLVKSGERYLCPFPSCGESFTSMQATFDHLKDHEQKTMLFGAAPGQDAHMHFYWPSDAPWRSPEWFNAKGIAAGSVGCSHCGEAFATKDKLEIHIRLNHNKKPPKELPRHIEVVGKPTSHVPDGIAFIDQCVRHLYFVKDCRDCIRCELSEGVPKPKFKFYKSMRINFTILNGSGGSSLITVGDQSKGVYIKLPMHHLDLMNSASFSSDAGDSFGSSPSRKKVATKGVRGLVQGIVVDAEKDPWVCISRLLSAKEARSEGVQISRLFDHDYELLPVGLQNVWYRAADIIDRFNLTYSSKIEFKKRMKNGEIPSENIFFIRIEDANES